MRTRESVTSTLFIFAVGLALAASLCSCGDSGRFQRLRSSQDDVTPDPEPSRSAAPLAHMLGQTADSSGPLIVIGWDGADWELLDPMLDAGQLPHLRGLIERGASARLATLKPMISPLIWTSLVTGAQPDVHGVLDFVRPGAPGEDPIPVTAADRQVPALWNILSGAGVRTGVVGWWASWPAEEVVGVVVSDRVAYQLDNAGGEPSSGLVYPSDAWAWLAPHRVVEADIGFDLASRFIHITRDEYDLAIAGGAGYRDPIVHLRRLLASTLTYHHMTLAILRREVPGVMLSYVEGTDTIAHLFGPYAPPRRSFIDGGDSARFGNAVNSYYRFADELLGEFLVEVGPGANVVLCSDHGFAWGTDRPREASGVNTPTAAWWHRDPGILVVAGPAFRPVGERRDAHVLDLAPTLLRLYGLPRGRGMAGDVMEWALAGGDKPEAGGAVDYANLLDWQAPHGDVLGDVRRGSVIEKLQALGYLADNAEMSEPAATPAQSARSLLNLGTVLLEQGRPEEALEIYQQALELDPESPGAWLKCGVAQHRLGHYEDSLASNRKVLELGGSRAHRESASVGMAVALVELERPVEAMQLLEAATAHLPDSFILWKMRGTIALGQGRHEPARLAFEHALGIDEDTEVYNRLASLVLELDRDMVRAAALWNRSLEIDPDQPRVREALAALNSEGADHGR